MLRLNLNPNTTPALTQGGKRGSDWTLEQQIQRFKERVTAVLGIIMVVFTLVMNL